MVEKREGSPFWQYCYEVDGRRHRGPTPYRHDEPGSNRLAKEWEDEHKVETRKTMREGGPTVNPALLTLRAGIIRYKSELNSERGDFKDIVTDYDRLLRFFESVLPASLQPKFMIDVTDDHVARLVTWRSGHHKWDRPTEPKISPATVNRSCIERLQHVFGRAREVWFRHIRMPFPNEPDWNKRLLDEPKDPPRVVTPAEHQALTTVFDANFDALYRFRLLTGYRAAECLLHKSQVSFALGHISVRGKGGKIVNKPLTPAILAILRECWNDHPTHVFTYVSERTRDGRVQGQRYPITYEGWKTYWRRRRAQAALICPSLVDPANKMTLTTHKLRHSYATNLQMATGDVRITQRGMGHAKVETTEVYAHVFDKPLYDGMVHAEDNHYLPGLVKRQALPEAEVLMLPPPEKTGTDE